MDMKMLEGMFKGPLSDFKEILQDMRNAWEGAEKHAEAVERKLDIIMKHWGIDDDVPPPEIKG